ncbi:MAG: sialidase family protein, partial [Polyangiaceae bacterium]
MNTLVRWSLVAALVTSSLAGSEDDARANGRFPATNLLVVRTGAPNRLLLRTTFGFLFSADRGATWDWVCERSVGFGGQVDPMLVYFPNGNVASAIFSGLSVSNDSGCSWALVPGDGSERPAIDLVQRKDRPNSAIALMTFHLGPGTGPMDASVPTYDTFLLQTDDDGATWQHLGTRLDPTMIVGSIEVGKSDPSRIYVSAIRTVDDVTTAFLLVSDDAGATWTERPVPLSDGIDGGTKETSAYVAALDGEDANRVYVRTIGDGKGRVLVTDDGGRTYREIWRGGPPKGFALSPEETKVWVGSVEDGLYVAKTKDFVFSKVSDIQVQCLKTSGSTLFACSSEFSGFILGASEDEGRTFAPVLHLSGLRGPLACPAGTSTKVCEQDWPKLKSDLAIGTTPVPGDAGARDSGTAGSPAVVGADVPVSTIPPGHSCG